MGNPSLITDDFFRLSYHGVKRIKLIKKMDKVRIHEIIKEAVEIETEFIWIKLIPISKSF